ncbi:MAG: hypothetical protein IH845_02545, partial [Nanoarchaeota archaeon]|nr:hypothetical protein [Nanoarchaeota archaeon]
MMFKPDTALFSYEVIRESGENVMYINYLGAPYVPSLVESSEVMGRTIDDLREDSNVSRVVFVQQRNYSHDSSQVFMLVEIADLYDFLVKQERIVSSEKLAHLTTVYHEAFAFLNNIVNSLLRTDPVYAYRELKSTLFSQKAALEKGKDNGDYIRIIEKIISYFDNLKLIKFLKNYFDSYSLGNRDIYSEVFRADIMPNFTFTRMVARLPSDAEIIEQYSISKGHDKSLVTIFKRPNKSKFVYHIVPPEYTLDEDSHMLLNLARNVMIEHKPSEDEFNDPERTRQVFFNVAKDLISELATNK